MTVTDDPHSWTGALVRGPQGEVLGHVDAVYFHDVTGRATWAAVTDGVGTALAPLDHAQVDEHGLGLPYRVDQLATAPRPASDAHLDPDTEYALYRHYGLASADPGPQPQPQPQPRQADHQPDGSASDDAEMVVSRERMRTRTERRAYARMRLVTYVVTEDVTFTVPVSRQEVRLEEIPFDGTEDSDAVADELVEDVHEVVLHREEVHFTKTAVPVERVRLVRHIVRAEAPVSAQLRREQVDVDHTPSA